MKTNPLLRADLVRILASLPQNVKDLLIEQAGRVFLAGGYIRSHLEGTSPNDVDLFVADPAEARVFAARLAAGAGIVETLNASTIPGKPAVQLIHRWTFDTPEDIIPAFDFSIGQAVIWHDGIDWRSICAADFYPDVWNKVLHYRARGGADDNPGGSLIRAFRFTRCGYSMPLDDMARLVADVSAHAIRSMDPEAADFAAKLSEAVLGILEEIDPPALVQADPQLANAPIVDLAEEFIFHGRSGQ